MKRFLVSMVALCLATAVQAAVTTHLSLDCRTGVRVPSAEGEALRYDASWCENGDEVRISDNGTVVMTGTVGTYDWKQDGRCSTHYLKLEVLSKGQVVGIETAHFGLDYVRDVTARQLWPHKKVEVCYTLADNVAVFAGLDGEIVLTSSAGHLASTIVGDRRCTPGKHCVVWNMGADGIVSDATTLSFSVSVMNATPGFITKTFSSPSLTFDKTSDVWSGSPGYVVRPDGLYATSLAEHTTVAYGCYMWMVGGVTYSFKGCYDDYVGVKVDSNWLMSNSSVSQEASGSFTPSTTGCYPVEFRVGNNGGLGGTRFSWQYGIKWCTSVNGTWRNVENTASETVFFTPAVSDEFKIWMGTSSMIPVNISIRNKDGMAVDATKGLGYSPIDCHLCELVIDGGAMLFSSKSGEFVWQPKSLGEHTIKHIAGTNVWTRTVNVTGLDFVTQKEPDPPGTVDETITLGLEKKVFASAARKPCMFAVTSTDEGKEWSASVSDDWITLTKTSGVCGTDKVTYYAEANTNAAERTGYVYVSGHIHTVVQPGVGAELRGADPLTFDCNGTSQVVTVESAEGIHWDVLPKAEWITIQPTSGDATGTVTLCAAPFVCVGSRTGTAIIAGQEVTFTQNGCDMQLAYYATNCTRAATTVAVGVQAIAGKSWTATSQAEWISISESGAGVGNGEVALSIEANAGHLTRTGFVTIGTETFKIVQEPSAPHVSMTRIDCDPAGSEVQVNVFVDSYIRWSVTNELDWVELSDNVSHVGPGAVVLRIATNTNIMARSGTLTVAGFEIFVNQAASDVVITPIEASIGSDRGDIDIEVTAPDYLQWQIGDLSKWVTLTGESSRTGSATLTFTMSVNASVDERMCEISIGGKKLKLRQRAASTAVATDRVTHGADSDFGQISVTTADYLTWNVATTNDWIDFSNATAFTGPGEVEYIYGDLASNRSRIGIIWVGKTPVYVCQCGFAVTLGETGKTVSRVSNDGQITVDVESDDDQWCAISTVPWITVKTPSGTGDGIVQYSYEANTTRMDRVGRILVCDQVFTLTQTDSDPTVPRWQIAYENLQGVTHTNPNHYDEGDVMSFTVPTSGRTGYTFAGWEPSGIAADDTGDKTVRATWTANAYSVVFDTNGGTGEMPTLAMTYGEETSLTACAFARKGYSFVGWAAAEGGGSTDWTDGEAVSNLTSTAGDEVRLYAQWAVVPYAITYADTKDQANANPTSYTVEDALTFTALGNVANFSFSGWTPSAIAVGSTGNRVVTANWNWIPSDAVVEATVTGGKPMKVKSDWAKTSLTQRFGAGKDQAFREKFGADLAAAMTKPTGKRDGAGNELAVWHDYVAGTDPTDTNSVFKAKVIVTNGMPIVEWEPNLNSNAEERVYTIWGKTNLTDAAWHTPTNECSKFFKVDVAMPVEKVVGVGTWSAGTWSVDTWTPATTNLLFGAVATVTGNSSPYGEAASATVVGALADRAVVESGVGLYIIKSNASVSWELSEPSDVASIRIYSAWGDHNRNDIVISSIETSSDGVTWSTLTNSVIAYSQTSSLNTIGETDNTLLRRKVVLSNDQGDYLALGVGYLRINFGKQDNGYGGYAEIEVVGEGSDGSAASVLAGPDDDLQ